MGKNDLCSSVFLNNFVRSTFRYAWFLTLAAMAALNLSAFWALLGNCYHPEHYRATRVDMGVLEVVWIQVCCAGAVVSLAWLRRQPDECRRLVLAGLVSMTASCVVWGRQLLGARFQCLDPILFCTACGWTVALWLQGREMSSPERMWSLRLIGFGRDLKTVHLLAIAVGGAAVALSVYYLLQQIHNYNRLGLGYADCGDYARIMYNTLHNPRELFLRVNPDKPLFFDHFQPGFLPFVPLWLLWPSVNVTSLLQVLTVMGCAAPIYWIGKELFRDKTAALLLVAVWLVFPSASQFIYSGSYGFHCGNLCLPLYFLALVFWIKGHRGWALLFAVWAILIKEEAAIPVGMFGLYVALFEKRRWLGTVIAVSASSYFLLVTSVIIPAIIHTAYFAEHHFAALGATKLEMLLSPWTKPGMFWGRLLAPSSFYFAALLLAPLLFIPLKKPSLLLVGSLVFLADCLEPILKSICYWYQAALLPVVFWAFAAALQPADPAKRRAVLSGAVMSGILLSVFFGNVFWSKALPGLQPPSPRRLELVQRVAHDIDPRGSLFATQRAAAHFITQRYLYVSPPVPPQIDYVLLDMRDSWRPAADLKWLDGLRDIQRQAESLPHLHLVKAEDGVILYSRHGESIDARGLVERETMPPEAVRGSVDLGRGITIVGWTAKPLPSDQPGRHDRICITTYSSVEAPVDTDLAIRCILQFRGGSTHGENYGSDFQPLGQCIWPVGRWVPGRFYADDFVIDFPVELAASGFSIAFERLPLAP